MPEFRQEWHFDVGGLRDRIRRHAVVYEEAGQWVRQFNRERDLSKEVITFTADDRRKLSKKKNYYEIIGILTTNLLADDAANLSFHITSDKAFKEVENFIDDITMEFDL